MPFTGVHVRSPAKHVRLQAANLENKCLYRDKCPRKTTQVYLCMSDSSELFESFSLLAGAKHLNWMPTKVPNRDLPQNEQIGRLGVFPHLL
jgi:hypothetical protein